MPSFPTNQHSYQSEAKPIANTNTAVTESGVEYPYLTTEQIWYEVELIIPIYYDQNAETVDQIWDFYIANQLSSSIEFECKGYNYIGRFTEPPQSEQLKGFGFWEITCQFFAQRIGKVGDG